MRWGGIYADAIVLVVVGRRSTHRRFFEILFFSLHQHSTNKVPTLLKRGGNADSVAHSTFSLRDDATTTTLYVDPAHTQFDT